MRKGTVVALCVAVALGVASTAGAGGSGVLSFKGSLTVAQTMMHPKQVTGSTKGRFVATLNGATMKFTLWYDRLSTVPANAYLYRGAKGTAGSKIALLCKNCSTTTAYDAKNTTGSGKGQVILTKPQINALVGGKTYVLVTTPVNPGGELRGQVAWVH